MNYQESTIHKNQNSHQRSRQPQEFLTCIINICSKVEGFFHRSKDMCSQEYHPVWKILPKMKQSTNADTKGNHKTEQIIFDKRFLKLEFIARTARFQVLLTH